MASIPAPREQMDEKTIQLSILVDTIYFIYYINQCKNNLSLQIYYSSAVCIAVNDTALVKVKYAE